MKLHPVFIYTIASVVILLWIANFVAGIVIKDYNPDPTIGGAVMLVLGLVLAAGIKGGGSEQKHKQGDEVDDDS